MTMPLVTTLVLAATSTSTLSLAEAMRLSRERPEAQEADDASAVARQAAKITWRRSTLPTVGGEVAVQGIDRQLELATPIGSFPFGDQTRLTARALITQPILDPARLLYEAPAADLDAEAATLSARRRRAELAVEAAERWLDLRTLDARAEAQTAFVRVLREQRRRVDAAVQEQAALEVDALRLALAVDDAEQGLLEIDEARRTVALALGRAVGREVPVRAAGEPGLPFAPPPTLEDAVSRAVDRRADLRALRTRIEAETRRGRAVWAELLPRLEAEGAAIYDSGAATVQTFFLQGTLRMSLAPFAAATRGPQAELREQQASILRRRYAASVQGIRLRLREALGALRVAEAERAVAERGVAQGEEAARIERVRYEAGASILTELLEAERVLLDRRTRLATARLAIVRAAIRLSFSTGEILDLTDPNV